jgi:hypothetical protein
MRSNSMRRNMNNSMRNKIVTNYLNKQINVDINSEFDIIRGGKVIAENVKFFPNGKDYRAGNKVDKLESNDSVIKSLN